LDTRVGAERRPRVPVTADVGATTVDELPTFGTRIGTVIDAKKATGFKKPVALPAPSLGVRISEALRPVLGWLSRLGWRRVAGAALGLAVLVGVALGVRELMRPPDPEEIALWRAEAKQALAAGKVGPGDDTAISLAGKVLKWVPEDGEAKEVLIVAFARLVAAGQAALQKGDLAEAEARLDEAQTLAGENELEDRKLDRRSAVVLADRIAAEESRRGALEREQRENAEREERIAELLAAAR